MVFRTYLPYRNSIYKHVHYRFEAGILEDMFQYWRRGLYMPSNSRLAVGASGHQAKKETMIGTLII